MFGDIDLRARLNRMGHNPFGWSDRKRRGSAGHPADPTAATGSPNTHHQYFQDDLDFPGFGGTQFDVFNRAAGRKRNQPQPQQDAGLNPGGAPVHDRHKFYDYLPQEFRHYFPESFGAFPSMRHQQPTAPTAVPPQPQMSVPLAHSPQQTAGPQYIYQEVPVAPVAPRPKLCDAAIQTESPDEPIQYQPNNLQQHGLRNTVDLGQKSQQEEVRQDRSHSAPPNEQLQAAVAAGVANSGPYQTAAGAFANTGTSMTPQAQNVNLPQSQFQYPNQQHHQPLPPQVPRPQAVPQQPAAQQFQAQSESAAPAGNMYTRTVPIFVEGRKVTPPQQQFYQQQQPPQQPQPQQHPSARSHPRPEPFQPRDETDSAAVAEDQEIPPQTPLTTDCINKIQDIQRDVLELMGAVDKFGGIRGDRQYMYIDEMLTRNLLKLDTIDTNGRDSIRLARKEAIRCIQASITVLEGKAEQNAKAAAVADQAATTAAAAEQAATVEESLEQKLANFQTSTALTDDAATPPTTDSSTIPHHVSEVRINLSVGPKDTVNSMPSTAV